jgi:hypothetical protein
MRKGRLAAWAAALVMAAGGLNPGYGSWPLTLGAWTFHHTNDGSSAPDWT